jgi:hypothetical protein
MQVNLISFETAPDMEAAAKAAPWASIIAETPDGWLPFKTIADYDEWEKIKGRNKA